MGSPRIPDPPEKVEAPPPPAPVVEELKTPSLKKRRDSRKRGASGLTIRRPSINV